MSIIKYDASSKRTGYFVILVTSVRSEQEALDELKKAFINKKLDDGRDYIIDLLKSAVEIQEKEQSIGIHTQMNLGRKRNYRRFYQILKDLLSDFNSVITYNSIVDNGIDFKTLSLYRAKIATLVPIESNMIISRHSFKVAWYRMDEKGNVLDEAEYGNYKSHVELDYKCHTDGYVLYGPGPNIIA